MMISEFIVNVNVIINDSIGYNSQDNLKSTDTLTFVIKNTI